MFWPVWIPYIMLLVERSRWTRVFLRGMTALGFAVGLGLMVPIFVDPAWLAIAPLPRRCSSSTRSRRS